MVRDIFKDEGNDRPPVSEDILEDYDTYMHGGNFDDGGRSWPEEEAWLDTSQDTAEIPPYSPPEEASEPAGHEAPESTGRTLSRRRIVKRALGAGAAMAALKFSYELGYDQRDNEDIPARTHTVTKEEAEMDYEEALVMIFREAYTNTLESDEEVKSYMLHGGVINETALSQGRQTKSFEAEDELSLPFPPNFKG